MVSVMQSNETGKYSLGYIRMGVPITIDQIQIVRMENGKHQVSLCFDSEDTDEKNFFENLQNGCKNYRNSMDRQR